MGERVEAVNDLQRWELRRRADDALMRSLLVGPTGLVWTPEPWMDLADFEWRVIDNATGTVLRTWAPSELPRAPRIVPDEPPGLLLPGFYPWGPR